MTEQNPELITHVPTAEELAVSRVDENATDFNDPEQLAAFNEALAANGIEPRQAPGSRKPVERPATEPDYDHQPYVEPESERRVSGEELRRLQAELGIGQIAAKSERQE